MSAQPAERASTDEPAPCTLTSAGWAASRPSRSPRLDAQPLLRPIELAGGDYALGVRIGSAEKRALERARQRGWVTLAAADDLAVHVLRMCPREVWGGDYFTA